LYDQVQTHHQLLIDAGVMASRSFRDTQNKQGKEIRALRRLITEISTAVDMLLEESGIRYTPTEGAPDGATQDPIPGL
jgi:hypothetical protein